MFFYLVRLFHVCREITKKLRKPLNTHSLASQNKLHVIHEIDIDEIFNIFRNHGIQYEVAHVNRDIVVIFSIFSIKKKVK